MFWHYRIHTMLQTQQLFRIILLIELDSLSVLIFLNYFLLFIHHHCYYGSTCVKADFAVWSHSLGLSSLSQDRSFHDLNLSMCILIRQLILQANTCLSLFCHWLFCCNVNWCVDSMDNSDHYRLLQITHNPPQSASFMLHIWSEVLMDGWMDGELECLKASA